MGSIIERVLLAVAVLCGAVAIWNEHLPAAVVTGGVLIAWAIHAAASVSASSER